MQHQRVPHGLLILLGLALLLAVVLGLASRHADARGAASFRRDVQPIFAAKCVTCHPVSYPYLDLRAGRSYDQLVGVRSPLAPAFERVLAGRPDLSYLLTHVPDPSRRHLLTVADRASIARWIAQGAKDN